MNRAGRLIEILSHFQARGVEVAKGKAFRDAIGLYLLFLGLACWSFYPIFDHLDAAFIGNKNSDVLRNAWGFWWFKAMLLERFRIPTFTVYLNYPQGLTLLVIDPLHCLVSIPLQVLFGLPRAYNLLLIMIVAFNGLGGAWLVRALTGRLSLAMVGGALYGFAPFVLSNAMAGTSEVVNMGWVPLFMGSLIGAIRTPSRQTGLMTGVLLICTASTSWYYGYIATLFGSFLAVSLLFGRVWRKEPLKPAFLALSAGAGLFLAFLGLVVLLFRDLSSSLSRGLLQGGHQYEAVLAGNAVNLWEVFAPAFDRWDRPSLYHLPREVLITALALTLVALLRRPGRSLAWFGMGCLGLLLSLSFKPQFVTGTPIPSLTEPMMQLTSISTSVYRLFLHLPVASAIRFPVRFQVIFLMGLSVCATLGLHALLLELERLFAWLKARIDARRPTPWSEAQHQAHARTYALLLGGLGVLSALLINARMLQVSRFHEIFATTALHTPEWTQVLKNDPVPGAVMHLPTDLQGRYQLYEQTLHERPLLGYVDFVTSRRYELAQKMLPMSYSNALYGMHLRGYDDFLGGYPSQFPEWPDEHINNEQLARLKMAGLRYVVLDRSRFKPESLTEFEAVMKHWLEKVPSTPDGASHQPPPDASTDQVDVYRLR